MVWGCRRPGGLQAEVPHPAGSVVTAHWCQSQGKGGLSAGTSCGKGFQDVHGPGVEFGHVWQWALEAPRQGLGCFGAPGQAGRAVGQGRVAGVSGQYVLGALRTLQSKWQQLEALGDGGSSRAGAAAACSPD